MTAHITSTLTMVNRAYCVDCTWIGEPRFREEIAKLDAAEHDRLYHSNKDD